MSVTVKLSPMLQMYADNAGIIEVSGSTVQDCLNDLSVKHPGFEKNIFDKHDVPKLVILLNSKPITTNKLDTAVVDSDVINLFVPVDGG